VSNLKTFQNVIKRLQNDIPVGKYLFKNSSPVYTIICGHISVQAETSQQTDAHIDENCCRMIKYSFDNDLLL